MAKFSNYRAFEPKSKRKKEYIRNKSALAEELQKIKDEKPSLLRWSIANGIAAAFVAAHSDKPIVYFTIGFLGAMTIPTYEWLFLSAQEATLEQKLKALEKDALSRKLDEN